MCMPAFIFLNLWFQRITPSHQNKQSNPTIIFPLKHFQENHNTDSKFTSFWVVYSTFSVVLQTIAITLFSNLHLHLPASSLLCWWHPITWLFCFAGARAAAGERGESEETAGHRRTVRVALSAAALLDVLREEVLGFFSHKTAHSQLTLLT